MTGVLTGKVALVTGGSKGIGLGVARKLHAAGANVVIADLDGAAFASSPLATVGDSVRFITADATEEADVQRAVDTAASTFGALHCMVCNAGGPAGAIGPIMATTPADFDDAIRLTLRSVFLGIRTAARHMIDSATRGEIITIGSVSAQAAGAGPPVYSAAKAALVRLTQNAAGELAPQGIRVNSISPGLILTEQMRGAGFTDQAASHMQPLRMAGLPDHVGDAAVFLASEAAAFVAGADLVVDGGALGEGIALYSKLGFNG